MASATSALTLLDGGPPLSLQRRLGLARPERPRLGLRMLLAVAIGWLPPLLIAAWSGCAGEGQHCGPWSDFSFHARALLAVPLLILAEQVCSPRLGAIAYHFLDSDLVRPADEPRYLAAVHSTLRLRDSVLVEVLVLFIAYALIAVLIWSAVAAELPAWHRDAGASEPRLSSAGWWHALVSLPLLLALLLGWLWRVGLWTRFLWLMTRLDLRLLPVHPDHAGGLRFVGYSARAYALLGFALGTIVAGSLANQVFYAGTPLLAFRYVMVGLLLVVLVLFVGPSLVFGNRLLQTWRRGVFEYGALADRVGRRFEHKWLHRHDCDDALEAPDFSATTDLYQIVANAYDMRLTATDLNSVLALLVATALPLLPVLLLALPLNEILSVMGGLLF